MASKLSGIELTRYDDLFKTDAEREADRQERIQIVPAAEIFPYSRQPYTIDRPTPDLVRLMDSIEHIGIAEPLIVRPRDAGGYEIISGHRRDYCAKVVGLDTRPVIVRNYSDEEADILVVDYNINREDLLPSEKAKAYKLKLDAMKRQAGRPSKNSLQVGENFRGKYSVQILADQVADNATAIQRYVRLNKLIPPLLDAVDTGTLKFVPAADFISHLSEKEQTYLLLVMERDEVSPSLGQAQRLKQLSAEGKLENMLKLPVPEAHYHNIALKPSEYQKEIVASLAERAEKVRNREVDSSVDNMLMITNDGRKLALDQRLVNPMLPSDPNSKAAKCAENVFEIWQRTAGQRSTQMIFCDLSTPKDDGTFSVYDDIHAKLLELGIPENEIAFIHNAKSEVQKKDLFGKVRSGQVRILLGSTQRMGAGTNCQQKLVALHHLDCPWRPSDLQQREGRIIRQGNENPEVDIYSYVIRWCIRRIYLRIIARWRTISVQAKCMCWTPVRQSSALPPMSVSRRLCSYSAM